MKLLLSNHQASKTTNLKPPPLKPFPLYTSKPQGNHYKDFDIATPVKLLFLLLLSFSFVFLSFFVFSFNNK